MIRNVVLNEVMKKLFLIKVSERLFFSIKERHDGGVRAVEECYRAKA